MNCRFCWFNNFDELKQQGIFNVKLLLEQKDMGNYSIKDLEKLSGIKAHTLRIWEKRHNLITPQRTETNIRYYTDEDLKKILNVSILSRQGIKISKIVKLSNEEINDKILEISKSEGSEESDADRLISYMVSLDEVQFERLLSSLILKYGFEKTFTDVVYTFLDKIGVLWQTGQINPSHEHFVSNLIRQKLMAAIDGLPTAPYSFENSFIFFLPEGELHELGLLFSNYLVRKAGYSSFYLGQSVPMDDLKIVIETRPSKYLMTAFISPIEKEDLDEKISTFSKIYPNQTIFISGFQVISHGLKSYNNVKILPKSGDLLKILDS